MNVGSVCSGIEAASVAWHSLGWRTAFVSEIDKFPCAVLAHHYPEVPNYGDMTKFKEWPDAAIDVLVGGTPCQSFSVAGLRKGLDDPRGNLTLTYLAVAAKYRPKWLVWENVPGVLSDATGAFGALLGGLGQLGYGFAYRILDAQYFGVPQRRRRVFVVGCFGDWRAAAAVLFERHSLQGNPAPSRQARERIANAITERPDRGGGNSEGQRLIAPSLTSNYGKQPDSSDTSYGPMLIANPLHGHHPRADLDNDTYIAAPPQSRCLNAGGMGRQDYETETLIPTNGGGFDVAHSLRGDGFDASEDGTGRGTPLIHFETMPTLRAAADGPGHGARSGDCKDEYIVPMGFAQNQREEVRAVAVAGALAAEPGMKQQTYIAFGQQNSARQGASASASITPTLDRSKVPGLGYGMSVRRLTPRECERLQGFPDDYTLIPYRNKPAADGPRYKALGNSMAVPVMRWVGERIDQVERASHD